MTMRRLWRLSFSIFVISVLCGARRVKEERELKGLNQ